MHKDSDLEVSLVFVLNDQYVNYCYNSHVLLMALMVLVAMDDQVSSLVVSIKMIYLSVVFASFLIRSVCYFC